MGLLVLSFNMGCSKNDNTPTNSEQAICYPDASIKKYDNTDNTKLVRFNAVTSIGKVGVDVVFELKKTSCKTAIFTFSYGEILSSGATFTGSGVKIINDLTLVSGNNYVGKLEGGIIANLKLPTSVPSISDRISVEYKEGDITYTFSGY